MKSTLHGYEKFGKLMVKEADIAKAWELFYDGIMIGSYDGKTEYDYETNTPKIDFQGFMREEHLQQLYIWKSFLEDRKNFFDLEFRKSHTFNLFFDFTILERYFIEVYKYIENDVKRIDFDIEYEKKKDSLKGISYTVNPNLEDKSNYSFEKLQKKIDSLISFFEEETESFQKKEQANAQNEDNPESATKKNKNCFNPKVIVDNLSDNREIWYGQSFPISKTKKGLYYVKNMRQFIARLYAENYIYEDTKVTDGIDGVKAEWIFENIKCDVNLENIKKYIRECKTLPSKKHKKAQTDKSNTNPA
jgi:hypothetical protein